MHRWHRALRLGIAAFAILFGVLVYFAIRPRPEPPKPATPVRTDPNAVAESTGGVSSVARGEKQDFKVEYARARSYADGSAKFEQVKVVVPDRGGRSFEIQADAAALTGDQAHVAMDGNVRLAVSDGLTAKAESATYDNTAGLLKVPGETTFERGRMRGSSVGATWEREADVLSLLDQARITFAADAQGGGGMDITAGSAALAQRDRRIRFERDVKVARGGQQIEADGAVAHLAPAEDRLEKVELRGHARIVTPEPQPGGLEAMQANDMDLAYAPDGQTLQRAVLNGAAGIQLAGAAGAPGRRLAGATIDLGFAPDGSTLVSLAARGGVTLEIPGEANAPARRIRAATLDASGPPEQGITNATFTGDVEFHETRPAGGGAAAVDRTARSRALETTVTPGFGTIDAATFTGGVTFSETGREARASEARYDVAKGALQLTSGPPGTPAARVDDARATVDARRIDLRLDGGSLVADGDVRSLLKAAPRGEGTANGTSGSRRPAMLEDEQPANVTSKHLAYDAGGGRAVYTGDARLWQGDTAIQADRIEIDDEKGDLVGDGNVRSTLRLEQKDAKTGQVDRQTTVVTSKHLLYEDAQRRATYTGDARMNGPEGDLRGDRIEMYLNEAGEGLERLEAFGPVTLRTETRTSTGRHLTYYAADERYVMSGAPVRVLEQMPRECRETLGKTLTFWRSADTISVDGNEESRTQTTSGGTCPEPRSK